MEKVFIYNDIMGLKGSSGILQEINSKGYYDAVIKIKEKRHRILLPISKTVIIYSEPIIEMDHSIELEQVPVAFHSAANAFLMQFQADILGVPVVVSKVTETTALGAAYLAGLNVGFWKDQNEIQSHWQLGKSYRPIMARQDAECRYAGWKRAVDRAKDWATGHNHD